MNSGESLRERLEAEYAQREERLFELMAPLDAKYAFGYLMQMVRVIAQPDLGYIGHFLAPPDHEDETYIAPFWFARDIPGLDLPRVT